MAAHYGTSRFSARRPLSDTARWLCGAGGIWAVSVGAGGLSPSAGNTLWGLASGSMQIDFLRERGAALQKLLHDVDHDRAATPVEMDAIDMEGPPVHLANLVAVLAKEQPTE